MPDDLRALRASVLDNRDTYRVALHECGHAVVGGAAARRGESPRARATGRWHGVCRSHSGISSPVAPAGRNRWLLAGRAAEAVVLGTVSTGAGGGTSSDLAHATALFIGIHGRYGFGVFGPLWLGDGDKTLLSNPENRGLIGGELGASEARARTILAANRDVLEGMAQALLDVRKMEAEAVVPWLENVRPVPPQGESDAGHSKLPEGADDTAPG